MIPSETYSFGGSTLDVTERRISGRDGQVALAPKAFDVLVALVRRAGRLVTKKELLETVWPEAFVGHRRGTASGRIHASRNGWRAWVCPR